MFYDYVCGWNWVVFCKVLVYVCDFLMMCKVFLCVKKIF